MSLLQVLIIVGFSSNLYASKFKCLPIVSLLFNVSEYKVGDVVITNNEYAFDISNLGRIISIEENIAKVQKESPHRIVPIDLSSIRKPTLNDQKFIENFFNEEVGNVFKRSDKLLKHLIKNGGDGYIWKDKNLHLVTALVIKKAPENSFLASKNKELLFNNPDLLNKLIKNIERMDGLVIIAPEFKDYQLGFLQHSLMKYVNPNIRTTGGKRFLLGISKNIRISDIEHELIHLRDAEAGIKNLLADCTPKEKCLFNNKKLRKKAKMMEYYYQSEANAYLEGEYLYFKTNNIIWNKERLSSFLYFHSNFMKLNYYRFIIEPKFKHILRFSKSFFIMYNYLFVIFGSTYYITTIPNND